MASTGRDQELRQPMDNALSFPKPEQIPGWDHPITDELQDLAARNSTLALKAYSEKRWSPFKEDARARNEHKPFSSLTVGPKDPAPRILLVSRSTQEDRYFVGRPYYPHWSLTPELFERAMRHQSEYEGNHLGRVSYGRVYRLNGAALNAEICGILFTKFFRGTQKGAEGFPSRPGQHSDWEIVSRFLNPEGEKLDHHKPEVFTYRSTFEPVYRSSRWEIIARERDISHPISGGLPSAEKGKLVEDLVGNALESLLGQVDNRHVRQVAQRLLLLHPYDQTHQFQFHDRVLYQLNQDPYFFLAEQFLLAGDQAHKIIPDPEAPVYIPNYGRFDGSVMGNMLVPDDWIKKTYQRNQVNALGELVYAASLARDDSNGRLRDSTPVPFGPGLSSGKPQMINSFDGAVERALIHTTLFLQAVNDWDRRQHGISPRLSGISKIAINKYGRFEKGLARHPLLYDDPEQRRVSRNDGPGPNQGPEDDLIGSSPRGGQPRLGNFA